MTKLLKSKALRMQLQLDSSTVFPGELLKGCIVVDTQKEVELTAIRLTVTGTEKAWVTIARKRETPPSPVEFTHLSQTFTVFGFSKASGRRGDAKLEAGTYRYPFAVVIPPNAPPSLFCDVTRPSSSLPGVPTPDDTYVGQTELSYLVMATAVIPYGIDVTDSMPFTVLCSVSAVQVDQARGVPRTLRLTTASTVNIKEHDDDNGCCCCVSFSSKGVEHMLINATLLPCVVILNAPDEALPPIYHVRQLERRETVADNVPLPPREPNTATMRIVVTSDSTTDVSSIRVELQQVRRLSVRGVTTIENVVLSSWEGPLTPAPVRFKGSGTAEAVLHLPPGIRHACTDSDVFVVPCVSTPYLDASTFLTFSFPGTNIANGTPNHANALLISGAMDASNRVPAMPCAYTTENIVPECNLEPPLES